MAKGLNCFNLFNFFIVCCSSPGEHFFFFFKYVPIFIPLLLLVLTLFLLKNKTGCKWSGLIRSNSQADLSIIRALNYHVLLCTLYAYWGTGTHYFRGLVLMSVFVLQGSWWGLYREWKVVRVSFDSTTRWHRASRIPAELHLSKYWWVLRPLILM